MMKRISLLFYEKFVDFVFPTNTSSLGIMLHLRHGHKVSVSFYVR